VEDSGSLLDFGMRALTTDSNDIESPHLDASAAARPQR
jgi:hypothetical protein